MSHIPGHKGYNPFSDYIPTQPTTLPTAGSTPNIYQQAGEAVPLGLLSAPLNVLNPGNLAANTLYDPRVGRPSVSAIKQAADWAFKPIVPESAVEFLPDWIEPVGKFATRMTSPAEIAFTIATLGTGAYLGAGIRGGTAVATKAAAKVLPGPAKLLQFPISWTGRTAANFVEPTGLISQALGPRKISAIARRRYQRRFGKTLGVPRTRFTGPRRNIGLRTADELSMIAGGQFIAEKALEIFDIDEIEGIGQWLGLTGLTLLGGVGGLAAQRAAVRGGKAALQISPPKFLDRAKKSPVTEVVTNKDINVMSHYSGKGQEILMDQKPEATTMEGEVAYQSNQMVNSAMEINDLYKSVLEQSGIDDLTNKVRDYDMSGTGGSFKRLINDMHKKIHPESSARTAQEAFAIASLLHNQRQLNLIGRSVAFIKANKKTQTEVFGESNEAGFLIKGGVFFNDNLLKEIRAHNKRAKAAGRKDLVIKNYTKWDVNKVEEMITGLIKINPDTGKLDKRSRTTFGILDKLGLITSKQKDYANRWVVHLEALQRATRSLNLPQKFKLEFDEEDNFFELINEFGFNPQAKDFRAMIPKGNPEIIKQINKSYGAQGYIPRIVAKFDKQSGERVTVGFLAGNSADLKLIEYTPGSSNRWRIGRKHWSVDDLFDKGYVLLDNYEVKGLFIANRIRKLGYLQQAEKLKELAEKGVFAAQIRGAYYDRKLLNLHIAMWKSTHDDEIWIPDYQKRNSTADHKVSYEEGAKQWELAAEVYAQKEYEKNINPHIMLKFDEHTVWAQNLQALLSNLIGKEKDKFLKPIGKDKFEIDFEAMIEERGLKDTIPLLKHLAQTDVLPSLAPFRKAWTPTTGKGLIKLSKNIVDSFGEDLSIKYFGTADELAIAAIIKIGHLEDYFGKAVFKDGTWDHELVRGVMKRNISDFYRDTKVYDTRNTLLNSRETFSADAFKNSISKKDLEKFVENVDFAINSTVREISAVNNSKLRNLEIEIDSIKKQMGEALSKSVQFKNGSIIEGWRIDIRDDISVEEKALWDDPNSLGQTRYLSEHIEVDTKLAKEYWDDPESIVLGSHDDVYRRELFNNFEDYINHITAHEIAHTQLKRGMNALGKEMNTSFIKDPVTGNKVTIFDFETKNYKYGGSSYEHRVNNLAQQILEKLGAGINYDNARFNFTYAKGNWGSDLEKLNWERASLKQARDNPDKIYINVHPDIVDAAKKNDPTKLETEPILVVTGARLFANQDESNWQAATRNPVKDPFTRARKPKDGNIPLRPIHFDVQAFYQSQVKALEDMLDAFIKAYGKPKYLIHGDAPGADRAIAKIADARGIETKAVPYQRGIESPLDRNTRMIEGRLDYGGEINPEYIPTHGLIMPARVYENGIPRGGTVDAANKMRVANLIGVVDGETNFIQWEDLDKNLARLRNFKPKTLSEGRPPAQGRGVDPDPEIHFPVHSNATKVIKSWDGTEEVVPDDFARQFSAMTAQFKDGRLLEDIYQLDIKEYGQQNIVKFSGLYDRGMARENPNDILVFGDNNARTGTGPNSGQAVIRPEPNAFGIRTKINPRNRPEDFLSDNTLERNKAWIDEDIKRILIKADETNATIKIPWNNQTQRWNLGTGRAALEGKAPKTFQYLQSKLDDLFASQQKAQPQPKGARSKVGKKGEPKLQKYTSEEVSRMYDDLWRKWFDENPELLEELNKRSEGKVLYDPYSPAEGLFQNQARSITKILDERFPIEEVVAKSNNVIDIPFKMETESWEEFLNRVKQFTSIKEDSSFNKEVLEKDVVAPLDKRNGHLLTPELYYNNSPEIPLEIKKLLSAAGLQGIEGNKVFNTHARDGSISIPIDGNLGEHTSEFYLKLIRHWSANDSLKIKDLPEPLQEFMHRNEAVWLLNDFFAGGKLKGLKKTEHMNVPDPNNYHSGLKNRRKQLLGHLPAEYNQSLMARMNQVQGQRDAIINKSKMAEAKNPIYMDHNTVQRAFGAFRHQKLENLFDNKLKPNPSYDEIVDYYIEKRPEEGKWFGSPEDFEKARTLYFLDYQNSIHGIDRLNKIYHDFYTNLEWNAETENALRASLGRVEKELRNMKVLMSEAGGYKFDEKTGIPQNSNPSLVRPGEIEISISPEFGGKYWGAKTIMVDGKAVPDEAGMKEFEEFINDFTEQFRAKKIPMYDFLKKLESLNKFQRVIALGFDGSIFTIQLLSMWFYHPEIAAKSVRVYAETLFRAFTNPDAVANLRRLRDEHPDIRSLREMFNNRVLYSSQGDGYEILEAFQEGGFIRVASERLKVNRFPNAFKEALEATLDYAGDELALSLSTGLERTARKSFFINHQLSGQPIQIPQDYNRFITQDLKEAAFKKLPPQLKKFAEERVLLENPAFQSWARRRNILRQDQIREINLGEKFDPDKLIFSKKTYDPRAQKELSEFINYFRGLSSSADLGISQRQRLIESIVLLAPRYRRAIAGLYAKLFSEDSFTRMEAQKALGRFIGGVTLTVVALQMMQSSFEEDSEEEMIEKIKNVIDPSHKDFMMFNIGGERIGIGSKMISDARMASKGMNYVWKEGTQQDLKDWEDFTKRSTSNPMLQWVRSQMAAVPSESIDMMLGSDFIGNRVYSGDTAAETLINSARPIAENAVPLWIWGGLIEGSGSALNKRDEWQGRGVRMGGDFIGLRAYPSGPSTILRQASYDVYQASYDDIEPFQKHLLKYITKDKIQKIREQNNSRVMNEFDIYFAQKEIIEKEYIDTIHDYLQVYPDTRRGNSDMRYRWEKLRDAKKAREDQIGLSIDWDDTDINDEDPKKRALALYYALFKAPELKHPGTNIIDWDKYQIAVEQLQKHLGPELSLVIERNKNLTPLPEEFIRRMSTIGKARHWKNWMRSENTREEYLMNLGFPELVEIQKQYYYMLKD